MKTIIETSNHEFIIKCKKAPLKNETGDYIYTDEKSGVGKATNVAVEIKFFEPVHEGDDTIYTPVRIKAEEIKELYGEIMKLEAQESEEFIDDL